MRLLEEASYKVAAVGAGLGEGFGHTRELKVMKYSEAMAGPERAEWKRKLRKKTRE